MPCFVAVFALGFPRLVLFCVFLFSGYLERAYHGLFWPLLGFFFMPLATLAYAWALNTYKSVEGFGLVVVVLAVLLDLGLIGSAGRRKKD
ncbi:MAG: hypothetical protein ACRD8O_08180 [Bryobacteraceae bacterium]